MAETNVKIDRGWTVNLSGILCFDVGALTPITVFLWVWKYLGII